MKKLVKVVALMMAIVLSVMAFSGCGNTADDKNDKGQTILKVGNWPVNEGDLMDTYNERKANYEKANPDVEVQPDLWAFDRRTFYAKAAGGQLPTLYTAGFTEMPEIISAEYSADMTDALKKYGYDKMLNPYVLDAVSDDDGNIMAFPMNCYIMGLAMDMVAYEKAGLVDADGTPKQPKDWNEVVEFAVKIKEATGKPGIVLPTAERSGGWIFSVIAWSFGVDFMEKDKEGNWKATFNTPECAEALQWYKDLKWKYDVFPANTIINREEWFKALATGNGAMTVNSGGYPAGVAKYGMTPDQIGMVAMPAGPKRHVTLLGGEIQAVKPEASADQIDAAVRWIGTYNTFNLTEDYKLNTTNTINTKIKENQHIGIQGMSIWNNDAPSLKWYNDFIAKNTNANPNHVRLYNECVADCKIEIQPEEPVCCQELYSVLDGCIQEVLTNKDADVKAVLEKANIEFQTNYLDNL